MKHVYLFLIGIMFCGVMTAQTNYDIQIAGTELTSANAGAINNTNFPNLGLTEGTITYDHIEKTITLNEVKANVSGDNIFIWIPTSAEDTEYKINLIGNNGITTQSYSVSIAKNLTIEGDGSLELSSSVSGIVVELYATLTISNTTLKILATNYGIRGYTGAEGETLIIEKSNLNVTGYNDGSICKFQTINFEDCSIVQPEGAFVFPNGSAGKAVMLNGAVVKEEVIIEPYYDGILIAGSGVNSGNANAIDDNNFPNLELQSGTITYAHDTKTFTLNSVNANVFSECLIYITDGAENADYKINLIGNSVINVEGHNAIWTFRNLTIQGNGSLELVSNTSCGIYVNNSTLNIKNTKVEAKGNWGIAGVNGSSGEILIIDNSTVKATGSNGSICLFQSITHPNCKIIQPEGAAVANNGSNGQAVMLNGSVVKSEVVIVPFYGIQIAGTKLNSVNAGNINNTNFPNLGLTEGTITYDHIGKTFTLTDVIATVTSGMFIEILNTAEDADYKINLIGNSVITVESHGIWTSRNLAVEGNGSLEIVSSGVGFFVDDNSTLYIKNTKVEVKGVFGIKGVNGTMGEILIIENSTVKATGSSGSICDLQSITHPECKIIQPEGAAVANNGSDGQAVMLNGSLVKSEVILTPNSGVNDVDAETAFSIYPNPANNLINIITENANELITISDLSGKVVYSEQASKKQNSIDISQLSVGMYIVRIGEKATKFVKE